MMDGRESGSLSRQNVIEIFDHFREELDEHNDRRERLIKTSRDITILSKKTISLLHRIVTDDSADNRVLTLRAAEQGRKNMLGVQRLFSGLQDELTGDRFWRYQRSVSPGLQEYIEALGLIYYFERGTLVTFDEAQTTLSNADGTPYFPLPASDYLLGLSDLTGELMRFAISGFGHQGGRSRASQVCAFVRSCKSDFERLTPYVGELSKKQLVTSQSLQKIEDAIYAVVVRGSEYDLPPDMLDDIVAKCISNFGESDHRRIKSRRNIDDEDDDESDM